MRCPVDNETLIMADRNGVEIDYCPKCRGVWLDRGELDKIIDRAAGVPATPAAPGSGPEWTMAQPLGQPMYQPEPARPGAAPAARQPDQRRHRDDDDDDDYRRDHKKRRRESFLGELFDF
jgi:Zn-finger nucleic acid-binding protein